MTDQTQAAEPVAWHYVCNKPGTTMEFVSIDPEEKAHWPLDQWKSVEKRPLVYPPAAAPAPAVPSELPPFDEIDDEAIDAACTAGSLYRVDLMRAYNFIRAMLATTPSASPQPSKYGSPELQALIVAHARTRPQQHARNSPRHHRRPAREGGASMIYQLLNKIFGWDYIQWRNPADQGVARVHLDGAGVAWYWRYKITRIADRIADADQVLWLTCSPEKYGLSKQAKAIP